MVNWSCLCLPEFRLFVLRWDLANNISAYKSSFLSKPLTCSLSKKKKKKENVQVARGWDFSFSDVSCEREELCLFSIWLAVKISGLEGSKLKGDSQQNNETLE